MSTLRRMGLRRASAGVALAGCAAVVVAGCAGASTSAAGAHSAAQQAAAAPAPPAPVRVLSIQTTSAAHAALSPTSDIAVRLSTPLAAGSAMPTLRPAVAGRWAQTGSATYVFTPTGGLPLDSSLTLTVPGGGLGVLAADGAQLAHSVTRHLRVASGSVLRLQQLLAELGYLPLRFRPTSPVTNTITGQLAAALSPPAGSFSWKYSAPDSLTSLWAPDSVNTITEGAVMAFESQHNLDVDGDPGPQVWAALIKAAVAGQGDSYPYTYVLVTKTLPETATVYRDGHDIYSTLANTGIAQAPTPDGTWPVYLRYTVTTMTGTNPDGSHYSDPGIPWVSYFHGGDALHGFIRQYYGVPQSLGCVEMPFANADVVWHDVNYGTLVTIAD